MERSRSKKSYHYDRDSNSQSPSHRSKPRYDGGRGGGPHRRGNHHRRGGDHQVPPPPPPPPPPPQALSSSSSNIQDGVAPPSAVTTFFRILCPDSKAGGVIGNSGSIIKTFRQETGASINVHQLVPGDEERIIETADNRSREPDGRPPQYSPAQEALLRIHERIVDAEFEYSGGDEEDEYGGGGGGGGGERRKDRSRVTTKLVVARTHVGCLLGKGGKIIEQMRNETRTHIRILPRDRYTPNCVSTSEEVVQVLSLQHYVMVEEWGGGALGEVEEFKTNVQSVLWMIEVVGEGNCVKKAVEIISFRLKESLHRDRGASHGRFHSPDHYILPNDKLANKLSGYAFDSDGNSMNDHSQSLSYEDLVFRILCPSDKVESVMGAPNGIIKMLQADIGVDVQVTDPVPGSDERIIIITSKEGPDDVLFPAQEALLHIQTRIVDIGPDKNNIITTRLLVPATDIACLEGKNGSLSDIQRLTRANIQILPKEDLPPCALGADELVQIVGEIRAARNALVQVTAKLRSYVHHDISAPKDMLPPSISALSHVGSIAGHDSSSPIKASTREAYPGSDSAMAIHQNMHSATTAWQAKDTGGCANGTFEQEETNINDEGRQTVVKRFNVPLVTRSMLEVIIPTHAVPSLIFRSGSKLAQISEMSGATVTLTEDRPEFSEKVVQISGSPEQAERAQSLLQGFVLSNPLIVTLWTLVS
ncbi:RNA-binding KH domain-containing protein RCF3 [Cocos nucifera]|uniref:RNA-binding KH domain-containing protein RCF3 n=1 Tax=Cocos nucifera TaxID=13894 RepID=A0A8K0MW56_COCNU|nr:RNA-binding KH domain-containing protein RCF3 [Cocos nucifera]